MEDKLWYNTPARGFSEALPLGNGSMGAMVYGNFPDMQLSLNLDTLWSGRPGVDKTVFVSEKTREKVRQLVSDGAYYEAEQVMKESMLGQWSESYLSAAFLKISLKDLEVYGDFTRSLFLHDACAQSQCASSRGKVQMETFISCTDSVLAVKLSAQEPVSICVKMSSLLRYETEEGKDGLALLGEAPAHVEPNYVESEKPVNYGGGMPFCILTEAVDTDGRIFTGSDELTIENMTYAVLLTAAQTGFRGWNRELEMSQEKLQELGKRQLQQAAEYTYATLRKRHTEKHREVFDRVSFELGGTDKSLRTTAERVSAMRADDCHTDLGLYTLLFQYGRYLMLCSSRPGHLAQPANLQGIWCEELRSVWSSNWTTNINVEMNYWLTGPCALSECDLPLLSMVQELAEAGRETARETCGCGGWAVFHNVDIWRQTSPVGGEVKWAFWPMGGVWLATHGYRHYLYTGDLEFLRSHTYPYLRSASEFCLDWLRAGNDGRLHSSPSTSPENTFYDEVGRVCCVSDSCTMDITLIRELFQNTADSARALNKDLDFATKLETAIWRLPGFTVGGDGQLQEWQQDFEECDSGHRHFAHLIGLHPFSQITMRDTPELIPAVKRTLERRMANSSVHIGWNEAWLINFFARLSNGDSALAHLDAFLGFCAYSNLFGLHPPLGDSYGECEIFQIDGNFGVTAGIAELLLQSQPGYISLLPALPSAWECGRIRGLVACGGCRTDIYWKDHRLQKAVLTPGAGGLLCIEYSLPFKVLLADGGIVTSYLENGSYFAKLPVQPCGVYEIYLVSKDEKGDSA